MSTNLLERAGELVVTRCWCGVQHGVPKTLYDMNLRQAEDRIQQTGIYCPLGHVWTFTVGDLPADRERKLREQWERRAASERAAHDQTKAELRETERRRRAEKGAKTRIKNRVAKGVCPCCNRYFANLHRHMENQHPDYTVAEQTAAE